MTTSHAADVAVAALALRLFVPDERFGWEFVQPAPASPSPILAQEPRWLEPPPPDLRALQTQHSQAKSKLPKACVLIGVLSLFGLAQLPSALGVLALLVALVMAAIWIAPVVNVDSQLNAATRRAEQDRAVRWTVYARDYASWQAAVSAHDHAERQRLAESMQWFPLDMRGTTRRVDVFGGCGNGRAVLFAVLGASLLSAGNRITLLDFTEEAIGHPLSVLAAKLGVPVTAMELPDDLAELNLLADLDATDAAELLASALHPRRLADEHEDRRDVAADLLLAVLTRLGRPLTVARLVAGLRALNNTYDVNVERILADAEVAQLAESAHDLVIGERTRDELRSLISRLLLLVPSGRTGGPTGSRFVPLGGAGLTIYSTTSEGNERRKVLLDRWLTALSIHAVSRDGGTTGAPSVLVVAGADHLGKATLESLARCARRSSTRLIYLFDHLRDDVRALLGGPDSATVLMRLGNDEEAAAAAAFIGRGHKFVLSQVSRQRGQTKTVGGGTSTTDQISESVTEGSSRGGSRQGLHGGSNWGSSTTHGWSESRSGSSSTSWSLADSRTDGQVDARVYEFNVEPTEIQALPPTAFVLVDNADGDRRVAMGNCDPRITEFDRLATTPR
jgi:hypothetical protein